MFNYSQEMCWAEIHSGLTKADEFLVNFPLHPGFHPEGSGSCLAMYRSEELNQLKSQLEIQPSLVKRLIWAIHHLQTHSTLFTKLLESSGACSLPPFLNSLQD